MKFDAVIFDDAIASLPQPKSGTGFAKYIKPKGWKRQEFWNRFINEELGEASPMSLAEAFIEEVELIWGDNYIAHELLRSTPNDKPNPLYAATVGIANDELIESSIYTHEQIERIRSSFPSRSFRQEYECEFLDEPPSANNEALWGNGTAHDSYPAIRAIRENPLFSQRQFTAKHGKTCVGCQYYHGRDHIVCAVHPSGWDGDECPDKLMIQG